MNTGSHFRPRMCLLVAAALMICGLAGCIHSANASGESPSPGDGKVIYRVGILTEPDNLNPFIGYLAVSFSMWFLAYDPLVGADPATLRPLKGQDSSGLATDWTVSPDGKTWTFTIRKNAKWQDGVPLTARDVAFTYNYIIKNQLSAFTIYTEPITKAVALDDTTVRFECSKPKANMLSAWVPILPEHIWSKISGKEAAGKYQNNPPFVGSGPFQCVEWKRNSYVRLVANPEYWRGRPTIDELYFEYYTNADTMVQDLKLGVIDGCWGFAPGQYRQLQGAPGIAARAARINAFHELAFNCYQGPSRGNPVLKDAQFRQALNWAVDKDKIAAIAYVGLATPATSVITSGYYVDPDWHWQPPTDQMYGFDIAKAGQLLDAAGYKDTNGDGLRDYKGKPIELRLWAEDSTSLTVGKLVASSLKSLGLRIDLTTMGWPAVLDGIWGAKDGKFNPDFDMVFSMWYGDLDPSTILGHYTTAQIGSSSESAWSNPEYDRLYGEQAAEMDPATRKPIIDRLQEILYRETPIIATVYPTDLEAYNTDKWVGYESSPAKFGNVLFPPYGNAGSYNFLRIKPRSGATASGRGSSSATLLIAIGVAAVVLVSITVLALRRRRAKAIEE